MAIDPNAPKYAGLDYSIKLEDLAYVQDLILADDKKEEYKMVPQLLEVNGIVAYGFNKDYLMKTVGKVYGLRIVKVVQVLAQNQELYLGVDDGKGRGLFRSKSLEKSVRVGALGPIVAEPTSIGEAFKVATTYGPQQFVLGMHRSIMRMGGFPGKGAEERKLGIDQAVKAYKDNKFSIETEVTAEIVQAQFTLLRTVNERVHAYIEAYKADPRHVQWLDLPKTERGYLIANHYIRQGQEERKVTAEELTAGARFSDAAVEDFDIVDDFAEGSADAVESKNEPESLVDETVVVTLQRMGRGFLARNKAASMVSARSRHAAAGTIQQFFSSRPRTPAFPGTPRDDGAEMTQLQERIPTPDFPGTPRDDGAEGAATLAQSVIRRHFAIRTRDRLTFERALVAQEHAEWSERGAANLGAVSRLQRFYRDTRAAPLPRPDVERVVSRDVNPRSKETGSPREPVSPVAQDVLDEVVVEAAPNLLDDPMAERAVITERLRVVTEIMKDWRHILAFICSFGIYAIVRAVQKGNIKKELKLKEVELFNIDPTWNNIRV